MTSFVHFHPPEAPPRPEVQAFGPEKCVSQKKKRTNKRKAATQGRRRKPKKMTRHVLVFRGFCTDVFLCYIYFGETMQIWLIFFKGGWNHQLALLLICWRWFFMDSTTVNHLPKKKWWIHVGNILSFPTTLSNSKVVEKNMVKQLSGLPPSNVWFSFGYMTFEGRYDVVSFGLEPIYRGFL